MNALDMPHIKHALLYFFMEIQVGVFSIIFWSVKMNGAIKIAIKTIDIIVHTTINSFCKLVMVNFMLGLYSKTVSSLIFFIKIAACFYVTKNHLYSNLISLKI